MKRKELKTCCQEPGTCGESCQEMLRQFIKNSISASAIFDRDMICLACSDRYLQDYGVSKEQVIGKSHYEAFPEIPEKWREVHQSALNGNVEKNDDDWFERADGSICYTRWECRPWVDAQGEIGGIIIYSEVTTENRCALREAKDEAERQHAELQAVLDNVSNGVAVFDKDASQVYINPAHAKIFGFESIEAAMLEWETITKNFSVQTYPDLKELGPEDWPVPRVLAGAQVEGETYFVSRLDTGLKMVHIISGAPVYNAQGEVEFAVIATYDITELTRAQKNVERQKAQLQAILDNATNGISVFAHPGGHAYRNDASARIYGYDSAEDATQTEERLGRDYLVGQSSYETYPDGRPVPVDEWPSNRVLAGEHLKDELYTFRRKDIGIERILGVSGTPVRNAAGDVELAVLATQDITERKKAEEALASEKQRLQNVIEGTNVGTWEWNVQTEAAIFNERWAEIFGYTLEELSPVSYETWRRFCHPDDLKEAEWLLQACFSRKSEYYECEVRMKHKSGEWVWVLTRGKVATWTPDGKPEWMYGTHLDITERKKAEEEEKLLAQRMEQAQRLESLGVLAGGIAHDFNNLLMAILGHTDLALLEISELSPAVEDLNNIKTASRRAAELCTQLLAYSGQGQKEEKTFSISTLVDEIAQMLKTSISKKCILNLQLDRQLPLTQGDPSQMRQILMNFVLNASDAIGERSGIINISTGVMNCTKESLSNGYVIKPQGTGLYVTLEVSDNGHGMDDKTLARIFEPFFTTKFTGRGLGLSAVLGIIRSHGGGLRVYSEPGKGTSFKVLMPAMEAGSGEERGAGEKLFAKRMQFSGTVLLVDDEASVRAVCERQLSALGLDVVSAENGQDGLEVFRKRQEEIDLIILDLTMPKMGGEETFRELQSLDPDVKVVVASGYAEAEVASRFAGKSLSGFLRKPYTLKELGDALSGLLPIA